MIGNDRIELRAWTDEDIDTLARLRNDLTLQELLMAQPRPNSPDRVRHWLEEKSGRDDCVFFVIADRESDEVLGYIQVVNLNTMHGSGDLGICIRPDAHGKGFGASSIAALEEYLRRVFNLRKLVLQVVADNKNAVGFYLKLGFDEVGRLKQHFLNDGRYRDVIVMEKFIAS